MRLLVVLPLLIFAVVGIPAGAGASDNEPGSPGEWIETAAPPMKHLLAGDADAETLVPAPAGAFLRAAGTKTATFKVTYSGFPADARAAFQAAVDIWATQISSPVEITIEAKWKSLPSGVLGSAGPSGYQINPATGRMYPPALANRIAGQDLNPKDPDILAELSSSLGSKWYKGTDGKTPKGKYDLMTVVLHELGHGLGFNDSFEYVLGNGLYGFGGPLPLSYDAFVSDNLGRDLITAHANASAELGTAIVSGNLFWSGPSGVAGAGGVRPRLYAPNEFSDGSSIGHLDESTYTQGNINSLMTPFLDFAEAVHDPGPIVRGMLEDIGWGINSPEVFVQGDIEGSGLNAGDRVVAIVQDENGQRVCGQGLVANTAGSMGYSLSILGSSSPGCGRPGASVQLYFPETRQLATTAFDWPGTTEARINIRVGKPLGNKRVSTVISAD